MINRIELGSLKIDGEDGYGISDVGVDIDKLIDTRLLIQGSSGAGKSWLIRLICERVAGKVPFIIIDPEGEFSTLREKVDAVLVSAEGDIPADLSSAALLCRKLIELRVSAVIDIYELSPDKRREYVRRFLDALMQLPKSLHHPTLIIIDEAHKFAPERGSGQKDVVSTQSVIDLLSLGRKRGYAGILATQRFSKIHNDAIAETLNVLIGLTSLSGDQDLAGKYLGLSGKDKTALRDLSAGEFYGFGPALNVDGQPRGGVLQFRSDKVETNHPKAGQRHTLSAPKASDVVQQILGQLSDLPQQAEEEARDVASLEKKVRKLEIDLADAKKTSGTATEEKQLNILRANLERRESALVEAEKALAATSEQVNSIAESAKLQLVQVETKSVELAKLLAGRISIFAERFDVWKGELGDLSIAAELTKVDISDPLPYSQMLNKVTAVEARPKIPMPQRTVARSSSSNEVEKKVTPSKQSTMPTDSSVNPYQLSLLRGIAEWEALRNPAPTRQQIGYITGKKPSGSHFSNMVSSLRTSRYVDYPKDGCVGLTDAGRSLAGSAEPPKSLEEFQARITTNLNPYQRRIFDTLIQVYPNSISRTDLADVIEASASGSHFSNMVSSLKTMGLLTYPADKQLRASDDPIPGGFEMTTKTELGPVELYCDPHCGKGCTRAEYDRIVRIANEVIAMCGEGWTSRIWDNLGWHYRVISPCGRLKIEDSSCYPYGDFSEGFTCYISAPGEIHIDWSGEGSDPFEAVKSAFANMMGEIGYLFQGGDIQKMLPKPTEKLIKETNA